MSFHLLPIEKLVNASMKNRAEYSQLTTELNRIEKEKRSVLRMHNNEKQRLKAKYFKNATVRTEFIEASDVKMYETHNPGFCFRRNGEHRVPQVTNAARPIDFEHLQFLLFTNGEVDIEKVLCLHLLSSHETEHLTPPKRLKTSNLSKKHSPIEQLIERSKDYQIEATSSPTGLPTYVLDVSRGKDRPNPNEDERLAERLIVNEKILELITTVITTLENSNPEKVQDLVSLADDPSSLKRIFRKPHIQEFVMTLKEHSLVNSCSSFILTQPAKVRPNHIEVRTASGALEDLVRFIRSNVLQFPKRNKWRLFEEESKEMVTIQSTPPPVKKNIDTRRLNSPRIKIGRREVVDEVEVEEEINRFRRTNKDFIAKNIAAIGNFRVEEESVPPKPKKPKKTSFESSKIMSGATGIRKKIEENHELLVEPKNKHKSETSNEIKVHLKQTTCPACMEKWKVPLPPPKVSKVLIKNLQEPTVSNEGGLNNVTNWMLKTNSIQRISTMIEREQFQLSTYDRKYSNVSTASNLSQIKRKKSIQPGSVEAMDLSVFDLEKVRQAVREKETKKKLEKFLGD